MAQDKTTENLMHLIRGYFIPLVGGAIIVLVVAFIYFPNITGILANVGNISGATNQYNLVKSRIEYFKGLSGADSQLNLANNLIAINAIMPDQAKNADIINSLQGLAQSDGVTITNANGSLLTSAAQAQIPGLNTNVAVIQINLSGSGPSNSIRKFCDDISAMKPVASITDLTISGAFTNPTNQMTMDVNVYTFDSSIISKNVDMLGTFNTSYKLDYINSL